MIVSSTNENVVFYYVLRVFVRKSIECEQTRYYEQRKDDEIDEQQQPSRKRRRVEEVEIEEGRTEARKHSENRMELALTVAASNIRTILKAISRILTQIAAEDEKCDIDRLVRKHFNVCANFDNVEEILFCADRQKISLFQGEEWHEPSLRHIADGVALVDAVR